MSLKKIREHTRSLSLRLTLWYAGILTVSTVLLLLFFYHYIAAQVLRELDDQLAEKIFEFQALLENGSLTEVKRHLVIEVESKSEDTFFRVVAVADGREIAMEKNFTLPDKKPLAPSIDALRNKDTGTLFATVVFPGNPHALRTASGRVGQGLALQVGSSFVGDKKVLGLFRRMSFSVAFPLLIFSAVVGWFLARRELRDVEQVTLTAERITHGDYSHRVRIKRDTLEVKKLSDAFNVMLDRIQALIKGMKEVTDDVAHDLRSPLTRIRGQAEMALVGEKSADYYRDTAASTIEECDTLIDMINTMLDITEVEAGVDAAPQETVAINDLIRSACELFEPVAAEKDIKLTAVLADTQPYLRGDKHKIQRIVTNLIENGIKYNRPGGRVTVTATSDAQWLNIRVEDTGQGIAEKDRHRVFDRFYRGDTSRSEPGLGLGLSLVKAIVWASGGDIQVESVLNQGSCFTVRLPL